MNSQKTWLITGASRGIGLAVAKRAVAAGDRAAILARGESMIGAADTFGSNTLGLRCDIADRSSVETAVVRLSKPGDT